DQIDRERQAAAERQRLIQQLADAKFDVTLLGRLAAVCNSSCPEDVRNELQRRLRGMSAEEAAYGASLSEPGNRRDIANTCEACLIKDKALARADQLDRERQAATERQRQRADCDRMAAIPFDPDLRAVSIQPVTQTGDVNPDQAIY